MFVEIKQMDLNGRPVHNSKESGTFERKFQHAVIFQS